MLVDVPAEKIFTDQKLMLESTKILLKLLHNQEVDISNISKDRSTSIIKFSHPSYVEAIQFVISEEPSITKAKIPFHRVLSNVLVNLADDEFAASGVSNTVASNFDKLPEDAQNLLFKLADNKYAAGSVASAVSDNFSQLQNLLGPNKSDNFSQLQNLLSKISLNKEAGVDVASALSRNYDKLPKDIRELLFNLPYIDEEKAELMSYAIFPYLEKIIVDFAKEESTMDTWFRPPINMINYLSMLPEDARNKLLEN
jgi:hypothetical protein